MFSSSSRSNDHFGPDFRLLPALEKVRIATRRFVEQHRMRWLGLSKRCIKIAADYVGQREGFGVRLAERETVKLKLGVIRSYIYRPASITTEERGSAGIELA